jgi:hypothetical protein
MMEVNDEEITYLHKHQFDALHSQEILDIRVRKKD